MTIDAERFEKHLETVTRVANWLTQRVPQHRDDIHSVCRIALIDVLHRHSYKSDEEIKKLAKRAARNQGIKYLIQYVKVITIPETSYRLGISSPLDVEEVPLSVVDGERDSGYDPDKEYAELVDYCIKYIAKTPVEKDIISLRAEGIRVPDFAPTLSLKKSQVWSIIKQLCSRYKEDYYAAGTHI